MSDGEKKLEINAIERVHVLHKICIRFQLCNQKENLISRSLNTRIMYNFDKFLLHC